MPISIQTPESVGEFQAIITKFDATTKESKQELRRLRQRDREGFEDLAICWLKTAEDCDAARFLSSMIMVTEHRIKQLCNAVLFSGDEATHVVKQLSRHHPSLALWVLDIGLVSNIDNGTAERVLSLVEASADPKQLAELMTPLVNSGNSRIRSKAILLSARGARNPRWAGQLMKDPDRRIGANAVEALWDARASEEILEFFRQATFEDNPRIAANALVGLVNHGDAEAVEQLCELAFRDSPDFRASAAWAMGETGSIEFLPTLRTLLNDHHPKVKVNAIRALRRIQLATATIRAIDDLPKQLANRYEVTG